MFHWPSSSPSLLYIYRGGVREKSDLGVICCLRLCTSGLYKLTSFTAFVYRALSHCMSLYVITSTVGCVINCIMSVCVLCVLAVCLALYCSTGVFVIRAFTSLPHVLLLFCKLQRTFPFTSYYVIISCLFQKYLYLGFYQGCEVL